MESYIFNHDKNNSNVHFSRAGVDFAHTERLNKEYSLKKIFSKKVSKAHYSNEMYIHDLGILSYYCSSHSPAYVAKYGLRLDTVDSDSGPAKSAEVLVHHLITFMATMSNYFAGAIAYMFLNIVFAPYITKNIGVTGRNFRQTRDANWARCIAHSRPPIASARVGQAYQSRTGAHGLRNALFTVFHLNLSKIRKRGARSGGIARLWPSASCHQSPSRCSSSMPIRPSAAPWLARSPISRSGALRHGCAKARRRLSATRSSPHW